MTENDVTNTVITDSVSTENVQPVNIITKNIQVENVSPENQIIENVQPEKPKKKAGRPKGDIKIPEEQRRVKKGGYYIRREINSQIDELVAQGKFKSKSRFFEVAIDFYLKSVRNPHDPDLKFGSILK